MALLGKGVLAIWNGIAAEAEDEFVAWHVREHIPERVGLPGFLRGRRYVAIDGDPKYFNFYETTGADALTSPVYQARLDAPTEWTRRVVAHFTDTWRTVCDVAVSHGTGGGGFVDALRLSSAVPPDRFRAAMGAQAERLAEAPGIVAVHLLEGRREASGAGSAEKKLRGGPDRVADWVLLVEAVDEAPLRALRAGESGDAALAAAGAVLPVTRGLYRLQYGLAQDEIGTGAVTDARKTA